MANFKLVYACSLLLLAIFVVRGAAKCRGYTEVDSLHVVKVHAGKMTYKDATVECNGSVNGKSVAGLFAGSLKVLTKMKLQVDTWYMTYDWQRFKINSYGTVTTEQSFYDDAYPFICQCWDTKEAKQKAERAHNEGKWW